MPSEDRFYVIVAKRHLFGYLGIKQSKVTYKMLFVEIKNRIFVLFKNVI